jgi:uncharacterized protein (DUF885 family)
MSVDRRRLLISASAAAVAVSTEALAKPAAKTAGTPHARLDALFDAFMKEGLDHSPEGVTSLGLDKGPRAYQKSKLDDRSLKAVADAKRRNTRQLAQLNAFDRKTLTGMDVVNYDTVLFGLKTSEAANRRFQYGGGGAGAPYILSQLGGSYQQLPDFLDSQHAIETKADADAYLARLNAFPTAMDQEVEQVRHDAKLGVIPPDFIIERTLVQMKALRDTPADKSALVQSLVRRTKEKNIPGDWAGPASAIYTSKIVPALDRQIALMTELRGRATHDAGVWRLPDGAAYYEASVRFWTSTSRTADDIHKTGLDLVASYSARIDEIMKKQGLTQGTVGERLRGMYSDARFHYPNTDEGKEKLIADLNAKVAVIQAKLPAWFGTLPKAKLEIKRVPKYIEAGAPGGSYQSGALDGSRPGAYYINLRDTAEVPSWTLPTLTYHEGIPGHHLQLSIQQEADLPLIRKISFYSAYSEGWALYAEQLAQEMGMYADDPWGEIGYLHDAMFRAVRLVVDTGLHAKRWSREQAIKYFVDTLGDQEASATTEVERYCVWPGQACAYMLGKLEILKLRERAKTALGSKFDIREFHDAVLLSAAMPLEVLDQVVDGYIARKKGA